jgi:5-methylcytosine-specific restriction endonuclease McrA
MKKIQLYSNKGKTIYKNIIFENDPQIKSLASGILLRNWYSSMEDKTSKKIQLLKNYLIKRAIFLFKKKIENNGILTCHYCHKPNLIIGYLSFDKIYLNRRFKRLATVDHVISRKNHDPMDEKNWVVSCKKCNEQKADKPVEQFIEELNVCQL